MATVEKPEPSPCYALTLEDLDWKLFWSLMKDAIDELREGFQTCLHKEKPPPPAVHIPIREEISVASEPLRQSA